MKRRHLIILISAAVVLLGLVPFVFHKRNGKVIPRTKMARIYAEMFVTDQWISDNWAYGRTADTSFVYRPILEKYGYDERDWRNSVAKYIQDPDRYSRILKKTVAILGDRKKELNARIELIEQYQKLLEEKASYRPSKFYWPAGLRNPDNFVEGSTVYYVDSIGGLEWRFDPYMGYDTLVSVPSWKIVPVDSLRLDSLRLDSLRLDSLRLDSLRLDSLRLDSLRRDSLKWSPANPSGDKKIRPDKSSPAGVELSLERVPNQKKNEEKVPERLQRPPKDAGKKLAPVKDVEKDADVKHTKIRETESGIVISIGDRTKELKSDSAKEEKDRKKTN